MSLQTTSSSSHLSRFFTVLLTAICLHIETSKSNKISNRFFETEVPPFLEIAPQNTAHRSVFSTLTKCHHRMRVACVLLDLSPCCSLLATKVVLALPIIGAEGPEVATMGGLVLDGASFDG